jgi:hypothetical protein
MDGVWRPDVNDVERISFGKPAKKKGTGSRGVPHRLNLDERFLFDHARRKGYLEVDGSGWRSQRREAPLLNTYRSLCDARGQASIVLRKRNTLTTSESKNVSSNSASMLTRTRRRRNCSSRKRTGGKQLRPG